MDRIIYTAMSGARQSMEQQAVVSHNLANITTSGFRAQLSAMQAMPVNAEGGNTRVSVAAVSGGSDFRPGPLSSTGRNLDIAIDGDGWLAIQDEAGGEAYTRRGDLQVDGNGLLRSNGHPVLGDGGPIVLPLGAQVFIGATGTISVIGEGQDSASLADMGRLKLVRPGNDGLVRGDDGLFRTPPNAQGRSTTLAADQTVTVSSGVLEGSNVSAVEAMVSMIDIGRRYEMQTKVIQNADENAQRANSLLSLRG